MAGCAARGALLSRIARLVAVVPVVLLGCALCAPLSALAQFDHGHGAWTALLQKNVVLESGGKASRVDYPGFAKDRAALQAYLRSLSAVGEDEFGRWSRAQRAAFLVNAYNAYTVEKILTRYPDLRSIRDFGTLFGNPFKDRFFTLFGRAFSLDGIEHDTLRAPGAYDEPRLHFALNCASVGCPMLREEAYTAGRLEAQLEEQARRFLSDRTRNRYDPGAGTLEVSKIFDWYGEDWRRGSTGIGGKAAPVGSLRDYFARYADVLADEPVARNRIAAQQAQIRFLDYDWSLNDLRR